MPFVDNDGVNIYYEVEGEGDPLVLQHGLTLNLEDFRRCGYTDRLRKRNLLILIDARGHGRSDKPHESDAYRLRNFVNDIVAVLDDLGVERSHFLGYSVGGSIGLGIGVYSPERFRSLIIGGWGMLETDSEDEVERRKMYLEAFRERMEAWVSILERGDRVLPPGMRDDILRNDPEALIAYLSVREHVGFKDLLPLVDLPCLFYVGEQDFHYQRSKQTAEIIPGASFVSLPGIGHLDGFFSSEVILPHVLRFLASIS
ncbi:MAG: alpha/beta fold hydrolase [Candidatus Hermodarchaeia archaeon]